MLVGWAKPTPVITRNLRKIRRDDNLVTLAGPASNLLIVIAAVLVLIIIELHAPRRSRRCSDVVSCVAAGRSG